MSDLAAGSIRSGWARSPPSREQASQRCDRRTAGKTLLAVRGSSIIHRVVQIIETNVNALRPRMWHTQRGDRVLKNAEAKLFAESVLDLIRNELSEDGGFSAGIPVFDSLTHPQKLAVLHQVAHALFRPEMPMPELTAVLEGAVAAVIRNVHWLVEEEIELGDDDDTSLRELVGQACRDLGIENVPSDSCDDPDKWAFCVDCLHDAILWDSDYLGESNFVDLPPERSQNLKEEMGVADEYFQAVAQDPPPKQATALLAELEALCNEVAGLGHPKAAASPGTPGQPG